MNLATMRGLVRRDLKDEDSANYRWTNDEIDRMIDRALREYSQAVPNEQKSTIATTNASRIISISTLSDLVVIYAVEYLIDKYPRRYQRFSVYQTSVELLGEEVPDGSNCYIYWGKMHDVNAATWTIAVPHEPIIALGSVAYAFLQYAGYVPNRVLVGGQFTVIDMLRVGKQKLEEFQREIRKLKSKIRRQVLYVPAIPLQSKTTDWGP